VGNLVVSYIEEQKAKGKTKFGFVFMFVCVFSTNFRDGSWVLPGVLPKMLLLTFCFNQLRILWGITWTDVMESRTTPQILESVVLMLVSVTLSKFFYSTRDKK